MDFDYSLDGQPFNVNADTTDFDYSLDGEPFVFYVSSGSSSYPSQVIWWN